MDILNEITKKVFEENGYQKADINYAVFNDDEENWAVRTETAQKLLEQINEEAGKVVGDRIREISKSRHVNGSK
jgi:hypothetical protein